MKEGLLDQIRSHGHWRINIRPPAPPPERLTLKACEEAVSKSAVAVRGWNFPHVSRRSDDQGGFERTTDYVENWTDWSGMIEFWRMYRSSQFIAYVVLREDTRTGFRESLWHSSEHAISFIGVIYSVTEFFEFAHRLHRYGLYPDGASINVALIDPHRRALVAPRGRIPLSEDYVSNAEQLHFPTKMDAIQLSENHRELAVEVCLELFACFGWHPDASQIAAEQERFYSRRFAE